MYFTSSIFYVKMRVSRFAKKNDAPRLTWQCVGYHVLLIIGVAVMIWQGWIMAVVAYLPIIIRAFTAMKKEKGKLNLKRLGMAEMAYTLVFIIFLSLEMRFSVLS